MSILDLHQVYISVAVSGSSEAIGTPANEESHSM